MALAFAGARGQGGNALNGLHPCTLPQRALFAAVRRVSPLCASFRAGCECVCGTTGKANVAPTCAKNTKSQSSNAIAILRGGAAEWTRPAACGGARDMELVPTKEPASHLASRRPPAPCQMLFAGRSPYPLLRHKVRCACNALRERAFHAPLPCSSVPNKTRFAGLLFGRGKRKIRRKICEKTNNSVFEFQHRIWK